MKDIIRAQIQDIIDAKFQTPSDFIVNEIAPEIDEEDFELEEISEMIGDEIAKRGL